VEKHSPAVEKDKSKPWGPEIGFSPQESILVSLSYSRCLPGFQQMGPPYDDDDKKTYSPGQKGAGGETPQATLNEGVQNL
jgi:hypothetical protein